jgi:hypothetical protein
MLAKMMRQQPMNADPRTATQKMSDVALGLSYSSFLLLMFFIAFTIAGAFQVSQRFSSENLFPLHWEMPLYIVRWMVLGPWPLWILLIGVGGFGLGLTRFSLLLKRRWFWWTPLAGALPGVALAIWWLRI